MPPENYGSRYYKNVTLNIAWTLPAMQRLREDIEEQELEESQLLEAKIVLAYIMQKR